MNIKPEEEIFSRTINLIGKDAFDRLSKARVLIFGLGGVGGNAVEALIRSGICSVGLVDNDTVAPSNINRQIIATKSSVGQPKTQAMSSRIMDINPAANVEVYNIFYLPENSGEIDVGKYDYVIDAVDTVTAKLEIIRQCHEKKVPVISCMGTGNKLDPSLLEVTDIFKTHTCPLAKVMRKELKSRGISRLKVVYSPEAPFRDAESTLERVPASAAFVPPAAGILMASEVIKDLIK